MPALKLGIYSHVQPRSLPLLEVHHGDRPHHKSMIIIIIIFSLKSVMVVVCYYYQPFSPKYYQTRTDDLGRDYCDASSNLPIIEDCNEKPGFAALMEDNISLCVYLQDMRFSHQSQLSSSSSSSTTTIITEQKSEVFRTSEKKTKKKKKTFRHKIHKLQLPFTVITPHSMDVHKKTRQAS